jgi:Raf kinase inhibitor-like YbhB/YbcL family protein
MALGLTSEAFADGGAIPELYTCRGKNVSPPLAWSEAPLKTESFALVMEDADTPLGTITHWVLYNIPAAARSLPAALPSAPLFDDGMIQGRNGMRRNRYMGPCPPWGSHRYTFTLYALDRVIPPDPRLGKRKLVRLIREHILARAELMGRFGKGSAAGAEAPGRKR